MYFFVKKLKNLKYLSLFSIIIQKKFEFRLEIFVF